MADDLRLPMLFAKIHRATVTDANLHYEGSITIDRDLMDAAGLLPHQQVQIYNISNGYRFETYVIEGARSSGTICLNGAAAHLAGRGDLIIIAAYALLPLSLARTWQPRVILVDTQNRPVAAADAAAN
jgi:aspartate 1-decarboxylase